MNDWKPWKPEFRRKVGGRLLVVWEEMSAPRGSRWRWYVRQGYLQIVGSGRHKTEAEAKRAAMKCAKEAK